MLEINPNTLYSRDDLDALLEPLGLSAESFIERLRPRKVFRAVWFGNDLLEAMATASPMRERIRPRRAAQESTQPVPKQAARTKARKVNPPQARAESTTSKSEVDSVCAIFNLKTPPRIPSSRKS